MTLKKINILEYAFGEGGGGHQKAYAEYAFINVDNCERPLSSIQLTNKAHVVRKPSFMKKKNVLIPSTNQINQ